MVKDKNTKPRGKSKYQLKLQRRRKLAASLGVSDRPFPALWAIIDEREDKTD